MEPLADCPARQWLSPSCCYCSFTPTDLHILSSSVPTKNLFVICFYFLACSNYRTSMLHRITSTRLLLLLPFLSFPSMILSSYYTAHSSWITLKMKAASSSEMLVPVYQYTSHHIPKNRNLYQHHCENLKILEKKRTSKVYYALCPAYFDVQLLRKFLLYD
jgi:hypothetical protein